MNDVAQPAGQRRTAQSLNHIHNGTITWANKGWRISFSAQTAQCRGHFPAITPTSNFMPLFTTFDEEITIKTTGCGNFGKFFAQPADVKDVYSCLTATWLFVAIVRHEGVDVPRVQVDSYWLGCSVPVRAKRFRTEPDGSL